MLLRKQTKKKQHRPLARGTKQKRKRNSRHVGYRSFSAYRGTNGYLSNASELAGWFFRLCSLGAPKASKVICPTSFSSSCKLAAYDKTFQHGCREKRDILCCWYPTYPFLPRTSKVGIFFFFTTSHSSRIFASIFFAAVPILEQQMDYRNTYFFFLIYQIFHFSIPDDVFIPKRFNKSNFIKKKKKK